MNNTKIGFSWVGLIVFLIPMIINIVYAFLPPVNEVKSASNTNNILEIIENITRVLYCVAIIIVVSKEKISIKNPWFFIGLIFLILYYIVYIRYFMSGRDVAFMGKSFLFVPVPLAVFPVIYYICGAIWLHNYIAAGIMVVFGFAHYINSYMTFK